MVRKSPAGLCKVAGPSRVSIAMVKRARATLILEAAYEATMWAAVLNAQRGVSRRVLLTRLGGGAFGNRDEWIDAALRRSLAMMRNTDLDVRMVSYAEPSQPMLELASEFGTGRTR